MSTDLHFAAILELDGIPYQLDQLPRQYHFTRSGEVVSFSSDLVCLSNG